MNRLILFLAITFLFTSCDSLLSPQSENSNNNPSSSDPLIKSSHSSEEGNWEVQERDIIENELEDVYFSDIQNGWAVGGQVILHTDDGGENWQQQKNTAPAVNSVHFVDAQNGWVVGGQTILHTDNGGENWQQQGNSILNKYLDDSQENLRSVYFLDAETGWIVGSNIAGSVGTIFHTDDGGQSWDVQFEYDPELEPGDLGKGLIEIHFVDEQNGWAVGRAREITGQGGSPGSSRPYLLHTNDGGETWNSEIEEPTGGWYLRDVYFNNPDNGWIIGKVPSIEETFSDLPISITNDGGENWSGQPIGEATSLHFINSQEGWVVGHNILHTTDGGQSWHQQENPTDQRLNSVYFVNEQNGWAVGRNGTMLHYNIEEKDSDSTEGTAENIFEQSLQDPWVNASWDADVNFSSTQQVQSGNAIRVDQQPWGALSLRRGQWNSPQDLTSDNYEELTFKVYSPEQSLTFDLLLENDGNHDFPRLRYGTIEMNNAWATVTIPISKLNPDNQEYNRIDISESSGENKSYFVDDIQLTEGEENPFLGDQEAQTIYGEQLRDSWIDASWNANISYDHTSSFVATGSSAIRINQEPWGGLSVRSSPWGASENISPGQYEYVSFAVYSEEEKIDLTLLLENAAGHDFPRVHYGSIKMNNAWTIVMVPLSKLNPDGENYNRIDILESSGKSKIYFIDDLQLIKGSGNGQTLSIK